MPQTLLGTSGWSYQEWVGPFYENQSDNKLVAYSRVFDTVEIDSTFYAYPSRRAVMGWLRYSKPDFTFTAKLPQLITHRKRFDASEELEQDIKRFCQVMEPLQRGGKLGCLLIQLPPSRKYGIDEMEQFFKMLPSDFKYAIEFRHQSWMRDETWKLLKQYEVAYTIVDEPLLPPEVQITTDFAYFRWHGRGTKPWYNYRYTPEELSPWLPKLKEATEKVRKVYGYFNNHFHGYAVENCLQILEMLRGLTARQEQTKKRVQSYLTTQQETATTPKITQFLAETSEPLQQMLVNFLDPNRMGKMREILDEEVSLREETQNRIRANVRDYSVIIDLSRRRIAHDCPDWRRCVYDRKFCKHVGKLMLVLPEAEAKKVLDDLIRNRDKWQFLPTVESENNI